jgi:hypothetical protein
VFGIYGSIQGWKTYGGGAPKFPLFGIWYVDQMSIEGQPHRALLTDSVRWKRVIFQTPTSTTFQAMNDTFRRYNAVVDTTARTPVLTFGNSTQAKSPLTYQRPTKERLLVDGTLDGHAVHMELAFRDPDSYLVRSRGFHWIQELPFNR